RVPLGDIRLIRSHPSALDQCRRFLHDLPQARIISSATTADAAREPAEGSDPHAAAIASAEAASRYGLVPLADDVGDAPAFTRFMAIAPFTRLDADRELPPPAAARGGAPAGVPLRARPPPRRPDRRDRAVRRRRSRSAPPGLPAIAV